MAVDAAPENIVCPNREELAAFTRGQSPGDQLESILEHLSACRACASSVDALFADDTILRRLRGKPPHPTVEAEQACLHLEELVRVIAQRQTLATVSDSDAASVHEGPPLPAAFGAYLLLEKLDQGGMGVVYKARQETLKRVVALKMVRAGVYANAEERTRFQREGEVIARIHHPHVVQIHEFGEHQGQLFFSMELLEGGTLANKLNGRPLPEREAAELVRTLARTVQAAHEQGIVHRDLKPSNVLFAADGTVKITDFGLAKILDVESGATLSDAILGTPAYMAPEQARGESRNIGPAADVYALGVLLYETLTGQPPFHAASRLQTLELVRTREPQPPSRRRAGLSRDLEAICLKCLEKEWERRYRSAKDLAEDLQRWLDGRATQARPLRWPQRVSRMGRRHPGILAAVCLLAVLASLWAVFAYLRDPQRKIEDIQARLHRSQAVTLLGDKGQPLWSHWELFPGMRDPSSRDDEAFSMVSPSESPAMLILLPDPQGSYRLRAEVRHDSSSRFGHIGLCFAHSKHLTSAGWQHCFCTLTFNDLEAIFPDPKDPLLPTMQGAKPAFSAVHLNVHRASENGPRALGGERISYFTPAHAQTPNQYPWRVLAVEVRPEGFDLFWEADVHIHRSRQQILDWFDQSKQKRAGMRMVATLPELQPAFAPRDALGLFVYNGQASFRNVCVEPLAKP